MLKHSGGSDQHERGRFDMAETTKAQNPSIRKAPTVDEIEVGLSHIAEIIRHHGEAYLPIFLRLEHELKTASETRSALDRVMAWGGK